MLDRCSPSHSQINSTKISINVKLSTRYQDLYRNRANKLDNDAVYSNLVTLTTLLLNVDRTINGPIIKAIQG